MIAEVKYPVLDEIWSRTINEASLVLSSRERQYIYFFAYLCTLHLCHRTLCSHALLIVLESIKLFSCSFDSMVLKVEISFIKKKLKLYSLFDSGFNVLCASTFAVPLHVLPP